jgi:hypothetical protein
MPVAGSSADEAKLHQSEAHSPPEQQSCPLQRKRSPHCHHLWATPDSHLQLHQDQNASSKDSAEGDGAFADEIRRQWSTPAEVERARKFPSLLSKENRASLAPQQRQQHNNNNNNSHRPQRPDAVASSTLPDDYHPSTKEWTTPNHHLSL